MSRDRFGFSGYEITKTIKRDDNNNNNSNSFGNLTDQYATSSMYLSSFGLMGKRHLSMAASLGTNLNTITPCAACKLLRRRCAEECPFSPYFSPHEPLKFAAVHKVFGASNVSKMLLEVPERQRADAANSLVYEANLRLRDPIYGSMGAISALQHQIQSLQSELNAVRSEILHYKYREAAAAAAVGGSDDHHNPANINTIINNNIPTTTHHHHNNNGIVSIVSVAASPSPSQTQTLSHQPQPQPQPPPTPPPPPSVMVSSSLSSSSTTSSMYNPPCTAAGYGSISSSDNNVPFFD